MELRHIREKLLLDFGFGPQIEKEAKLLPSQELNREEVAAFLQTEYGAAQKGNADRILTDVRYKLPTSSKLVSESYTTPKPDFEDVAKPGINKRTELLRVVKTLEYLGFTFSENDTYITATYTKPAEDRAVRIRKDEKDIILTVKGPIEKNKKHKERNEIEASIGESRQLTDLLNHFGFLNDSVREKKRTSYEYKLNGVDVKVEYNISPFPDVPPWLEVESSDDNVRKEVIKNLVKKFKLTVSNSTDAQMYQKTYQKNSELLKSVRFPKK